MFINSAFFLLCCDCLSRFRRCFVALNSEIFWEIEAITLWNCDISVIVGLSDTS